MIKFDSLKVKQEREKIRKEILTHLRSINKAKRSVRSREIKKRLFNTKQFQTAKSIMFYVSKAYEVDTREMIDEALALGKRVMVPVTDIKTKRLIPSEITDPGRQLSKGAFGVYEPREEDIKPVPPDEIDMVIVPGVVFDKRHNRIGHGGGYFDRFLQTLPKHVPTIGLAFSFQLVDRIKTLPWDVPVTGVITA